MASGTTALLSFGVLVGVFWFLGWVLRNCGKATQYDRLRPRLEKLESREAAFLQREQVWQKKVTSDLRAIDTLTKEKSQGFPWLATAFADYFHLQDLQIGKYLEKKKHPARRSAEHLREIAVKRKKAEKLYRILKYQLEYYENLFPWLIEFKGEDIDELICQVMVDKEEHDDNSAVESDDPAKQWLTAGEYATLAAAEKYQLALDRYWRKKKSKWEIGRDYERYIGYLYESEGYAVYYQGIVSGLADLGRDLIATKNDRAEIIQCKHWSKEKEIHEKHIFQLYGTVIAYKVDNPRKTISACFVTSTNLSSRAKQFAEILGIKTIENCPLQQYPCVKCNVSRRDETKIYHLPFDQQYDKTLVEDERNEFYAWTVREAEEKGFCRAFRWRGASSQESNV